MRHAVLVDLDHTLSDAAWRDHLMPLIHETGDWRPYYECQRLDAPLKHMVDYVKELAKDHDIIVITAREESYKWETKEWLKTYGVPFCDLLMRPKGNKMKSPELKLLLAEPFLERTKLVIDDRDDVLVEFQARGIPVMRAA